MNLKISIRFLFKNRLLSLLSILVLTSGMSSFMLIFFYIQYERNYDSSWIEPDRIFRIILEKSMPNGTITTTATNYDGLCRVIKEEMPEVEEATGFQRDIVTAFTPEHFLEGADFFWCDSSFFKVFDRPFIAGDENDPFPGIQSAVISERAAMQLFGRNDPVNERFRVNEGWEFIVSGVFAGIPDNSHLNIDILVTRKTLHYFINNFDNSISALKKEADSTVKEPAASTRWLWENPNVYTYVRLRKNSAKEQVERAFPGIYEKYTGHLIAAGQRSRFILQPVQSIHLDSHVNNEISVNSDRKTIIVLYIIAIIALAMSWVIFINFQITQSMERAKEFGLKKVTGAGTSGLMGQIVLQSLIINSLAILFAFLVFFLLKGESASFMQMSDNIPVRWRDLVRFVLIFYGGSLLSSIYPAYILISASARELLSDRFVRGNDGFKLRRSLIVFQYSASIGLMIATSVIVRQVWFMQNRDVGLNIVHTAYSYTPMSMIKKEGAAQKLNAFMEEAGRIPGVVSVTVSSCIPGNEINFHSNTIYPSGNPGRKGDNFGIITIDHHFQDVFKPRILAGRMFSYEDNFGGQKVIINREACKALGFGSPEEATGMYIQVSVNDYLTVPESPYLVLGVIEDFNQESPRKKIGPILLIKDRHWRYEVGFIALRFDNTIIISEFFKKFGKIWENFYPADPFAFRFTTDNYRMHLRTDERIAVLSTIYTCLSVVLAALGLYGLAANSARKRVKEIGIRKINGAETSGIMLLLNRDFIKWIMISFLIAAPIAWYAMDRWLENYAYKTGIAWWLFLVVGLISSAIALMTVSWQSWKAASINPVKALRYE